MPLPNVPTIQTLPNKGEILQAPIYSPTQENVFERLLQLGGQRLENPQAGFAPFEERARSQFYQNTIPGLAERFTAMGGGQKSSAFQGALGQAGSDLESQLAQLRQTYGQQQEQMGLNMLGTGLTPQYNQAYYQPYNVGPQLAQAATKTAIEAAPEIISGVIGGAKKLFGGGDGGAKVTEAAKVAAPAVAGALGGAGLAGTTAAPTAATAAPTVATAATTAGAGGAGGAGLAGAAKSTSFATAMKAVGAIGMPVAVAALGAWWLHGILKADPSQPGQFPNPFANGTYYDKDGNRIVSEGNMIKIFDKSGNMIDTTTFAGPNQQKGIGGGGVAPQPGQQPRREIYNYYGTNKPQAGPFYEY